MKKLLSSFLILASTLAYSQETTTFILLRHAEKALDGTKDPVLTTEGNARALKLRALFLKTEITAIYSTNLT